LVEVHTSIDTSFISILFELLVCVRFIEEVSVAGKMTSKEDLNTGWLILFGSFLVVHLLFKSLPSSGAIRQYIRKKTKEGKSVLVVEVIDRSNEVRVF
jgi:hypothetical protein